MKLWKCGDVIEFTSDDLRGNVDVITAAVINNGLALK